MSRQRLVGLTLLGALLLSVLPSMSGAQTNAELNAEFFEQVVSGELSAPLLAGPFDFTLEQSEGVLSSFRAGVDTRNFVAHAVFTNPEDGSVAWDYGFQFRTTGENEDLRIFIVSDGTWNLSVGTEPPEQSAITPAIDTAPGATNTLDLIVEEYQAIFGINGEYVGVVALPDLDVSSGNVFASTGFFSDLVVPGRVIELRDFAVYQVPTPEAPEAVEQAIDPSELPPRPVLVRAGSCGSLGNTLDELREATYPIGDFSGQPSAIVAETSFTRIPVSLEDLLADSYAINVVESPEAPTTSIACGDIGGIPDEIGGYVIALSERNGSGYRGVAYLAVGLEPGETTISVFLVPAPAAAPPVDAPVEPEAVPVEAMPAAEAAASPMALALADDEAAGTEALAATPAP